jgi:hypothetical protein
MTAWQFRDRSGGVLGKRWFACFLTFFLLYLLADTFLEDGAFGSAVTFSALALALAIFFNGGLSRAPGERGVTEAEADDGKGHHP